MYQVGSIFISFDLTIDRIKQYPVAVNDSISTNQLSCTYTYQYLHMIIKSLIYNY